MRLDEMFLPEEGRIVKGVNTTCDVGTNEIAVQSSKFRLGVTKNGIPIRVFNKTHPRDMIVKEAYGHPTFSGKAWRAPGFEGAPSGLSAADIVRHEIERGNVDSVSPELMNVLEKLPSREVMWVGRNRRVLWREYGPDGANQIEQASDIRDVSREVAGGTVIADDPDFGALVLLPGFEQALTT